jgi:hypothetical protein
MYSYGRGISSVILLSIRKSLCSLNFIITMTQIKMPHDIHVKNSNVVLEIYKICLTTNVSLIITTDEIPCP